MGALPTPYYQDSAVVIYHGDCRDILPLLGPRLVITDPPYNIGYEYKSWKDNMSASEYAALLGVLSPPCVVIHLPAAMYFVADAIGCNPLKVVAWVYNAHVGGSYRSIAWFDTAPDMALVRREYRNPDDKRVKRLMETKPGGGPRLRDWWHIEQVKGNALEKHKEHHCQIPMRVMENILNVTPSPLTVVDPFMGTGTTLRAAKDLGRKAIGIEIEEKYCEIAAKRMRQEVLL